MVAIFSNKKEFILKAVSDMYTDVAQNPGRFLGADISRLARVADFARRAIGD